MRIAIIIGKTTGGEWVTLAHPDVPLPDQKLFFKQLKAEEGRGVLHGNERIDLTEAYIFESGDARHMKYKHREPEKAAGIAKNLKDLAAVLEISKEELDVLRKSEGFPEKGQDGYNVEAVRTFAEEISAAKTGKNGE